MMVSTKGRYALRLMVDLALHDNGKFIALKDVSARQKISIKYLEQIVTPLNRAGLLKSGRGAQGGYRLAKNTTDYTVGEILRAIEGSFAPHYMIWLRFKKKKWVEIIIFKTGQIKKSMLI